MDLPSIPINPIIGGNNNKKEQHQHMNKFLLYNNTHSASMMMAPASTNDVNNVEFIGSNRLKMLADNYLQHTQFINRNSEVRAVRQTFLSEFTSADVRMMGNDESAVMVNKETNTKPMLSFSIEAIIGIK